MILGFAALAILYGTATADVQSNPPRINSPSRAVGSTKVYLPFIAKNYQSPSPLWRFGAAKEVRPLLDYGSSNVTSLRLGWYLDWSATFNAPQPFEIEYVPMVRVKQWKLQGSTPTSSPCTGCPYVTPYTYTVSPSISQIQLTASNRPGMLWVIGNEIERRDWLSSDGTSSSGQDEILPELYAQAYHELYFAIKSTDPTAQIAIGGMIEATPLRLKYLDRVWNGYLQSYGQPMPVDIWNIHAFVLQEVSGTWGADIPAGLFESVGMTYSILDNKNFSIVAQQINAFRSWMKQHGQQNKPLIITEYGVLMPDWVFPGAFTPEQVRDSMMYPSFDYFLKQTDLNLGYAADGYRLVQRWNWYSLDGDLGHYQLGQYIQNYNGNLFYSGLGNNPLGLATLGIYWQQYVRLLSTGSAKPYAPFKSR